MLVIDINNEKYNVPQTWSEMTLEQAVRAHNTFSELPEGLVTLYNAVMDRNTDEVVKLQEGMSNEDALKNYPEWYGKFMCAISEIPEDVMDHTDTFERTSMYLQYYEWIAYGLMFYPADYQPKPITEFEHGGVVYKMPEEGRDMGGKQPGSFLVAGQFAQSSDLIVRATNLQEGNYDNMRHVVAILCLPEGEKYNEQSMLERAERFKDLPMSVVWEVYFFIVRSLVRQSKHILEYLPEVATQKEGLRLLSQEFLAGVGTEAY